MNITLNIANILKNYPKGTRVYSPIFGEGVFQRVTSDNNIVVSKLGINNYCYYFESNGHYFKNGNKGECLLFPSKSVQDWTKLTWKKGNVLVSNDFEKKVIFDSFSTSDYSCFKGKHYLNCADDNKYKENMSLFTVNYQIEDKDDAQCFINTIEERFGGKLNRETLEIEPVKSKWIPKPFQYVLTNDSEDGMWTLCQFSHIDKDGNYVFIGGNYADKHKVIPYNKETAKLLGTTKNYEKFRFDKYYYNL